MPSTPVKKRIIISLISVFCTLSFFSCVEGEGYTSSPTENFEALWRLLDEKYCFFDYKKAEYGLDWMRCTTAMLPW